jgi:hypothetical protein
MLCVQMREDALVIHGSLVFRFRTLDVLLIRVANRFIRVANRFER